MSETLSAEEKKRRWMERMAKDPEFRARAIEKMSPNDGKAFTPTHRSEENIAAVKELDELLEKHFGVIVAPPQQ